MTTKNADGQLTLVDLGAGHPAPKLYPRDFLRAIRTRREAYRKAVEESRYTQGEVAAWLGIDEAQFSNAIHGKGKHLDNDRETQLERVCGNLIVSQWAALQHGYELRMIKSEAEQRIAELEATNAELQRELDVLAKYELIKRAQ